MPRKKAPPSAQYMIDCTACDQSKLLQVGELKILCHPKINVAVRYFHLFFTSCCIIIKGDWANSLAMIPFYLNKLSPQVCRECIEFSQADLTPLDDEGYEVYCKWCTEVGTLVFCDKCKVPFCKDCIVRNFNQVRRFISKYFWFCFNKHWTTKYDLTNPN